MATSYARGWLVRLLAGCLSSGEVLGLGLESDVEDDRGGVTKEGRGVELAGLWDTGSSSLLSAEGLMMGFGLTGSSGWQNEGT